MVADTQTIEQVQSATEKYKYGFVTDIEMDHAPKGLSEDIFRKSNRERKCTRKFANKRFAIFGEGFREASCGLFAGLLF